MNTKDYYTSMLQKIEGSINGCLPNKAMIRYTRQKLAFIYGELINLKQNELEAICDGDYPIYIRLIAKCLLKEYKRGTFGFLQHLENRIVGAVSQNFEIEQNTHREKLTVLYQIQSVSSSQNADSQT